MKEQKFKTAIGDVTKALDEFAGAEAEWTERTKSTVRLMMWDGEPFGIVLSNEECNTLSADQLRVAFNDLDCCVIRCPDGSFNALLEVSCSDYDFVDAAVTYHKDGSFEVVEIVNTEKEQIERIQRECHVSRADAVTMFGWWHVKGAP